MLEAYLLVHSVLLLTFMKSSGFTLEYQNMSGASLIAQLVKNLPTMEEVWVRSPGCEDALEKEMAAHPSILAWRIP